MSRAESVKVWVSHLISHLGACCRLVHAAGPRLLQMKVSIYLHVSKYLVHRCAKYINQESLTMVNQPSKVFKHVPTIENVDWRGAQILSESFLLSCAFEKPAVGGSAGILIVIPSTAFFKETCERNHIDTLVVKDSRRASAGALIKTKLSDEVDLFVKLVQNSPAETRLWRHDLTDLLTYLKKFYILKLRDVPNGEFLFFDCSCPRFRMKAKCKHAVAAGMYTGKFRVPTEKSLQIIKRKAKAGRPKKNIHPRG